MVENRESFHGWLSVGFARGEGLGENRGWGGLTGECGSLDYFAFPLSLAEVAAQG
jgi:hypothetical protein